MSVGSGAVACTALALAVLCLPGPAAAARLRDLWPRSARLGVRARLPGSAASLAMGAVAGFLVAGPGGAVAGVVIAGTVRRRRAAARAAAHAALTATELADALRRITAELRAGAHPAAALDGVSTDGPQARAVLAEAAAAAQLGNDVAAALHRSAARQPAVGADIARVAESWSLAERHGVPLADLLGRAQADIAWRVQYGRRIHAQLAGPRSTATVLTGLPGLGLLLGQLLGADPLAVLRTGLLGQLLLVVGVGLTAAGFAWSEHILRSAMSR